MVSPPSVRALLWAHVPFRCLLPQRLSNVLVTGLGISAHRDAIPVVRMQADVQNQGYAAGLAAAWAAAEKQPLRDLDLRRLQHALVKRGILDPAVTEHVDSFPLGAEAMEEAAAVGPGDMLSAATLFSDPEAARRLLRVRLVEETNADRRLELACTLGLMGDEGAAEILADHIANATWDDGWNFRGMGQFGRSLSVLDGCIIALARTESPLAIAPIREKIAALDDEAALSHCRAVAVAAGLLRDAGICHALAELLKRPGIRGHAQTDSLETVSVANADPIETRARSLSLRELHLARGLYLGGDIDDLGRKILKTYARDLRGPFARHAMAVLQVEDRQALARQSS